MFDPISVLPPHCDEGGRQQPCLLPGSQHRPLLAHSFWETAANKRARTTGDTHPSAISALAGMAGGQAGSLRDSSLPCFLQGCASSKVSSEAESYPKPLESISWKVGCIGIQKPLLPLGFIFTHPADPGGHSEFLCQPRHCSLSPALPILICAVWIGCHRQPEHGSNPPSLHMGGLGASNGWETTWAALQTPPSTLQLNWGFGRCSSCLPRKY